MSNGDVYYKAGGIYVLIGNLNGEDGTTITHRGQWLGNDLDPTLYSVGDLVTNNEVVFLCFLEHTSSASPEGDEPGVGAAWENYWVAFGGGETGGGLPDDIEGVVLAHLTDPATAIVPSGLNQFLQSAFAGPEEYTVAWGGFDADTILGFDSAYLKKTIIRTTIRQQKADFMFAGASVATSALHNVIDVADIDWANTVCDWNSEYNALTPIETDLTAPVTIYSNSFSSNTSASDFTYRIFLPIGSLSSGDVYVRLLLSARPSNNTVLQHVTIAQDADSGGSGDAYGAFDSEYFKEFLFAGVQGCTVTSADYKTSDWLEFTIDEANAYWIGISTTGSTNIAAGNEFGLGYWYKSGSGADWNVQDISGYSYNASVVRCVAAIQICGGELGANMVVISNPLTISETVAHVSAALVMKYKNSSTKVYVSTASSPSWTEVTTLTEFLTNFYDSQLKQYNTGSTAHSGSGDKQLRWKVVTDKGYSPPTEFYGITMGWTAS
jgi:hypothetical protein